MKIPFFGLDRQYAALKEEILEASNEVYSSGQVLDGEKTSTFETLIAGRANRKFAVAVNSCSTALLFAYLYYAQDDRKKVILPSFSFVATANAPKMSGFDVNFVDVDNNGLMNLDELKLREDSIRLISYVNLYGNVLDYDKLLIVSSFFNEKLPIIEDAAQSFGATYKGVPSGKLGDVSCLSFDPTKNLPNYGSGGMILTDDADINQFVRNLRDNGKESRGDVAGINSKMSESDCAQMIVKLRYFDKWQARRRKIAEFYNSCLHPYVDCPSPNPDVLHAWHKYVFKTADQFELRSYLHRCEIDTKVHYSTPLSSNSTTASRLSVESVSLPIFPELTDAEVCYIVDSIQKFYD